MKDIQRLFMIIGMLVLLGSIAGCGYIGGQNTNPALNPYAKYYTGTRGAVVTFVSLPTRLYYYGSESQADNQFVFGADLRNSGASFTRGGLYLSGFDPNLIAFREFQLNRNAVGACGLSIGSIGFGELGGIFRCDGVEVGVNAGGIRTLRIDDLQKLINGIGKDINPNNNWWDSTRFKIGMSYVDGPGGQNFVVNFQDAKNNLEYYQHGRLFIAVLAGTDFRQNHGREFLLAGNTYDFPGGEGAYFEYNGKIIDWPPGLDQTTQTMMLTTCYQYTTFADPIVCIDPQPYSDNRKVCSPQSRSWGGGNGAPVAITSIEQENTPRKIIFHINVRNVGSGTVYDPVALEKCSPYYPGRTTPADLNVVYLGDVRIGTTGLRGRTGDMGISCYPEVIRLDPNTKSGSTTCTYPIEYINLKSAYQTPLVVELWYGYSEVVRRDVIIKRVI